MRICCSPDMDIMPVHRTFDVESRITENGSCRQILTSLARICRMYGQIFWFQSLEKLKFVEAHKQILTQDIGDGCFW
jgi:hypothetical protein